MKNHLTRLPSRRFVSRLAGCLLGGVACLAQAQQEAATLLSGGPDPTVVAGHGQDTGYFAVTTGKGIKLLGSEDGIAWQNLGTVFEDAVPAWAKEAIPESKGIWAPDVSYHNGLYHVYYSVSSFGSQRSVMGLVVNKSLNPESPDYQWEDRGLVLDSDPTRGDDFNAIDPALFVDDDGQWYFYWGSCWEGLKVVKADPATGKPIPGAAYKGVSRRDPGHDTALEGAYVVKRDGWYYLFTSWGGCCDGKVSTYHTRVGRSQSPMGPFVDASGRSLMDNGGTLVLASHGPWYGTGHNSVVQREDGLDLFFHHAYLDGHIKEGRLLFVRPMYWTQAGWPVVGEPLSPGEHAEAMPVEPKDLLGAWNHTVNYSGEQHIALTDKGRIVRDGQWVGDWRLQGRTMTMVWHAKDGAGFPYTDEVVIDLHNDAYIGRNAEGAVIHGVRPGARD